jgi:hypothetical protein
MRLVDRVAQVRTPFIAASTSTGVQTRLSGASDYADEVASCPIRYVLSDDLTRLCAALAYSKGAQTLCCDDLLRVPAERVWVEWAYAPWRNELDLYGFPHARASDRFGNIGRRGAMLTASRDGRCGQVRTFWSTGESEFEVCASSMLANFDFDAPAAHDDSSSLFFRRLRVTNGPNKDSALQRCFEFEFEKSWANYYERANLNEAVREDIVRHSISTIALDIPLLLTLFLLLNTRSGLPQKQSQLDRLNNSRIRAGKAPLLDHIEVLAPFPSKQVFSRGDSSPSGRRRPRLHHVRGHLVRHQNELFWRMPHLRGNANAGTLKTRTVTWALGH